MKIIQSLVSLALLAAPVAAQQITVAHAPFQGTYSEGFESWNGGQFFKCATTDVGVMCSKSKKKLIHSPNLITPYCHKQPHSGNWLVTSLGMPPKVTFEFSEPMQRFGMWVAHTGELQATTKWIFFDAAGDVIDVQERNIPACPWKWVGWQAVSGDGFSKVKVIHYGDDCAALAIDDIRAEPFGDGIDIGRSVCDGERNSTGATSSLDVRGSRLASCSAILLEAHELPHQQFGAFLMSRTADVPDPGTGMCLGDPVLRVPVPVQSTADHGTLVALLDTADVPILAGETWSFQAWHRDAASASRYSEAVTVAFE